MSNTCVVKFHCLYFKITLWSASFQIKTDCQILQPVQKLFIFSRPLFEVLKLKVHLPAQISFSLQDMAYETRALCTDIDQELCNFQFRNQIFICVAPLFKLEILWARKNRKPGVDVIPPPQQGFYWNQTCPIVLNIDLYYVISLIFH